MRPLGEALAARGFPVRAVRLAGHGTEVADLAGTRWTDWFASVTEGADRLRRDVPALAVAGMSLGALLALHLAATRPAEVSALVLCGTPLELRGAGVRWLPLLARIPCIARRWATIPKPGGPDIADPAVPPPPRAPRPQRAARQPGAGAPEPRLAPDREPRARAELARGDARLRPRRGGAPRGRLPRPRRGYAAWWSRCTLTATPRPASHAKRLRVAARPASSVLADSSISSRAPGPARNASATRISIS